MDTGAKLFLVLLVGLVLAFVIAGIIKCRADVKKIAGELPDGKYSLAFFRVEVTGVYPFRTSREFGVILASAEEEGASVRSYKNMSLPSRPSGDDSSYLLVEGYRANLLLSQVDLDKLREIDELRIMCSI